MQVESLAANQTLITTDHCTVLVSYQTPVACCRDGKYYRTAKKWSATTSKCITQWLNGRSAEERPQEFFDSLLS